MFYSKTDSSEVSDIGWRVVNRLHSRAIKLPASNNELEKEFNSVSDSVPLVLCPLTNVSPEHR